MPAASDLSGMRFGKLIAVSLTFKHGRRQWVCVCDCGGEAICEPGNLRGGNSKSCGCVKRESIRAIGFASRKHGHKANGNRATSEYQAWAAMKHRCSNPANVAWKNYGGRGIYVCERWRNSFEDFFADMGYRPDKQYDLDRINNNGNYEPGNVRWATRAQNVRNQRSNFLIEINGVSKCGAEWAEIAGRERHTIINRYKRGIRGDALLA